MTDTDRYWDGSSWTGQVAPRTNRAAPTGPNAQAVDAVGTWRSMPKAARFVLITLAVVIIAGGAVGAFLLLKPKEHFTVIGTMTLMVSDPSDLTTGIGLNGDGCAGAGGYSDISAGTQVVIKDSSGASIATGELGEGSGATDSACVFSFKIKGVPASGKSDVYSVEVSHRGDVSFKKADAGFVALSLGDG